MKFGHTFNSVCLIFSLKLLDNFISKNMKKVLFFSIVFLSVNKAFAYSALDTLPTIDGNVIPIKTVLNNGDKIMSIDSATKSFRAILVSTLTAKINSSATGGTVDTNKIHVSRYSGSGVPAFTPSTGDPIFAQASGSPYPIYQWNGSAWIYSYPLDSTTLYYVKLANKQDRTSYLSDTATMLAKKDTAKFANGIRSSISGGGGGGISNLALGTVTTNAQSITNSNGTGFTLPSSTTSTAGLMSAAQTTQLALHPTGAIQTSTSLTGNGTTGTPIKLVNDATPTATQYYGTNSGSTLGYYNLPSSGNVYPSRITGSGYDVKYWIISGTPTVSFSKSGGIATVSVSGGAIELSRVQVDVTSTDLSGDALIIVCPTTQSGSNYQYPQVTKINRQGGGAPTMGNEYLYSMNNNPQVEISAATAGTSISVKIINISVMNTTAGFVLNF